MRIRKKSSHKEVEEFLPSSSSGNHLHVVIMSFIERWRICIVCWHSCILSHTHTCTISEESGWAKVLRQTTATRTTSAHLYGNEYFCWSFVRMINARYVSAHAVTSVLGDAQMAWDVYVRNVWMGFFSFHVLTWAAKLCYSNKHKAENARRCQRQSAWEFDRRSLPMSYSFIPALNRIQSMQRLSVIPISQWYGPVRCRTVHGKGVTTRGRRERERWRKAEKLG